MPESFMFSLSADVGSQVVRHPLLLRCLSAQMKANYRQLSGMNRELIREHEKRATNYSELLAALKEVNSMIQMASRLRVGGPAKSVVAACRQAIKTQNTKTLLKILKSGDAS
jgi:Bardet-Biedl syndrome 2 protein